jgi:hypothetical protein
VPEFTAFFIISLLLHHSQRILPSNTPLTNLGEKGNKSVVCFFHLTPRDLQIEKNWDGKLTSPYSYTIPPQKKLPKTVIAFGSK